MVRLREDFSHKIEVVTCEGRFVGIMVGSRDGAVVGWSVGAVVGRVEGSLLGAREGDSVGGRDGATVGSWPRQREEREAT
jgi:outer membrane lipoprotein SlyB